jgi:hypothetical protein
MDLLYVTSFSDHQHARKPKCCSGVYGGTLASAEARPEANQGRREGEAPPTPPSP